MATVGVTVHLDRTLATDVAGSTVAWLTTAGHVVRLPPEDAALMHRPDLACAADEFADGLDLVVSVGGDGTMLRTIDLVGGRAPVLGVNVGQLGYLAEVEPSGWQQALEQFLAGDYGIDERMLLSVSVDAPSRGPEPADVTAALNEAVLERNATGHTVRLAVSIDGEFFTTFMADALIVATPTGSTAYSMSARGPVMDARLRALLLTAVSPHGLFDRSLVLDPSATVRLEVCGHRPAALSVDGRSTGTLVAGDAIECTAAKPAARLVTFGPRHVHTILKTKFGLNDR